MSRWNQYAGFGLIGLLAASMLMAYFVFGQNQGSGSSGTQNATILIIRHAEKPKKGHGLSKAGEKRAKDYVAYFQNYQVDSVPLKVDYLYTAADTSDSRRPRLTLEPFSKAVGMSIDSSIKDDQYQKLVSAIQAKPAGKQFLICWHHEEIPQLIGALGADSKQLIHSDKWPEDVYDWVIQLRYDSNGQVMEAKRITEQFSH